MKKNGLSKFGFFILILALVSISCGVADLPFLATETPTPTATFTPSPTSTPTQTPTSTPTNTPTATPLPTGVTSEEQADGSTLFIDYDNGFKLILPSSWIVFPLDPEGLTEMLDEMSQSNPEYVDTAEAFQYMDTDVFRMAALYADTSTLSSGFGTNITVAAFRDEMMSSMPLSFVTGVLEQSFIDGGSKVLTQGVNVYENDHGVEIEYLDIEQVSDGVKLVIRMVVFQTDDALIAITITVPTQYKDDVLPVGEAIAQSIELLE